MFAQQGTTALEEPVNPRRVWLDFTILKGDRLAHLLVDRARVSVRGSLWHLHGRGTERETRTIAASYIGLCRWGLLRRCRDPGSFNPLSWRVLLPSKQLIRLALPTWILLP